MNKSKYAVYSIVIFLILSSILVSAQNFPETPIPSTDELRGLKDTVGFAISAPQMDLTVELSKKEEADKLTENAKTLDLVEGSYFIAGISPHDDYIYAGPVYIHLYPYIKAKRVIIFGVSHYARK